MTQLRTIGPFPWQPRPFTLNAFNRKNLESSAYLAIAVFRLATSRTIVANMHKIAFTPRLRFHGEGRQRLTDHAVLQRGRQVASSDKGMTARKKLLTFYRLYWDDENTLNGDARNIKKRLIKNTLSIRQIRRTCKCPFG